MSVRKVNGYKAFSRTKGALSKQPKSKKAARAQHYAVLLSQVRRGKKPHSVLEAAGKALGRAKHNPHGSRARAKRCG